MTETFLDESIRNAVQEMFSELQNPVRILFFGSQADCEYCEETLKLAQEVADLSELISIRIHDLDLEPDLAAQVHVDKAPTLVIAGLDGDRVVDYGVRFAGIPAGHEFGSLIHVIGLVSKGGSGLEPETRRFLAGLKEPLYLQVFVTPT